MGINEVVTAGTDGIAKVASGLAFWQHWDEFSQLMVLFIFLFVVFVWWYFNFQMNKYANSMSKKGKLYKSRRH